MAIETIWAQYVASVGVLQLKLLVAFVLAYFLLSVVAAIMKGECRAENLTNILDKSVLPIYLGLGMVAFISLVHPKWETLIPDIWMALDIMVFGLIVAKGVEIGLPDYGLLPLVQRIGKK